MAVRDAVTACIVAGGRARRLGGALKPLLLVEGETILARQRAVLEPRAAELVIALALPAIQAPLAEQGVRAVYDVVADAGPLAGIAAGFAASARPWLLVVAGDMPYLAPPVLDALLAAAAAEGEDESESDAVVPRVNGYPEPLCALYHRRAAAVIEAHLAAGDRRTQGILEDLRVTWLDEPHLRALDPRLLTFTNVNVPEQIA